MNFGIYTRKSYYSDKSDSIKMQTEACREYIGRFFDQVSSVTVYEDDGYVRSNIDRPGMNRLKADAADGLIDCVLIYKIDRVSSNMMDFCTFYTFLKERGIKFVTVKDGIDTTTPMGEAMMYLAVIFSHIEVANDSLRITDNMNHLASAGYWCGGQAPLGYRIQEVGAGKKRHKTLVPDPEGQRYKDEIVELFLSGGFTLQGLETYTRNQGMRSILGKPYTTTTLHQILTSPYCVAADAAMYDYFEALGCVMDPGSPRELWDGSHGCLVYGRTMERSENGKKIHCKAPADRWRVSIGVHEPTMSSADYLRIQSQFGHNIINKKMMHDTTLLKGVLRCKCGRLMGLARKPLADGSIHTAYKCPRRERYGKDACDMSQIPARLIDEAAMDVFRGIQLEPEMIKRYIKTDTTCPVVSVDKLRHDISDKEAKIERLTRALSENADSSAGKYIVQQIEALDVELIALNRKKEEAMAQSRREASTMKNAQAKLGDIVRLCEHFDDFTMEEKNAIAREVIKEATWDGDTLFLTL